MRSENTYTGWQARRLPQEVATRLLDRLPLICVMLLLTATVASGETPRSDPATHAQQLPELRADQPAPEKISRNLAPRLAAGSPARFRELASEQGFSVRPRGVLVDVQTQGLTTTDRARFEIEGVTIDHFSVKYQRVSAVVRDPAALRALAALPVVRYIAPEPFTALGGAPAFQFAADGTYKVVANDDPDLAAVDGNNTTFFGVQSGAQDGHDGEPDGFPNFFGTSAAAPVAALLQEYAVDLTPAKLEAVLETTARDVEGAPASTGDDLVTGAGLIDARAALDEFPAADAGPDQTVAAGSNVTLAAPVPRTTRPSRPSPGRRSPDHP